MGTPRAYKFFVKISACRLNLSTPEVRNVENKDRILCGCKIESGRLGQCAKPTKLLKNILRTENK
jgi:hypothetical protein